MRSTILSANLCALIFVSPIAAQTDKIQKERVDAEALEKLIAEALKNNPDIRVAESKVRDAHAELDRVRMRVAAEVALLNAEIETARALADHARQVHERVDQLYRKKVISREEFEASMLTLLKAKAELAVKEAKLPYILGRPFPGHERAAIDDIVLKKWQAKDPTISDEEFLRRLMLDLLGRVPTKDEMQDFLRLPEKQRRELWLDRLKKEGPRVNRLLLDPSNEVDPLRAFVLSPTTREKLRTALNGEIKLKGVDIRAADAFEYTREHMKGINLVVRFKPGKKEPNQINIEEPIKLAAFLQLLEDEFQCVFIVREYGIVVVAADERLPPGAVRVSDVWKQLNAPTKTSKEEPKIPNPPPFKVDAKVNRVDPKDGRLVEISIGSDAGIKIGHTLDAYRTEPQAKFLATIQVISVNVDRAVGRIIDAHAGREGVQAGDRVAAQITPDDEPAKK